MFTSPEPAEIEALLDQFPTQTTLTLSKDDVRTLLARLAAAEAVCVLFGWSGAPPQSETEKALHQAWSMWAEINPGVSEVANNPDLNEAIPWLAAVRDETRDRTLERIKEALG